MKNTECTIYITTKHGWTQSYRKEKNGWTQTGPNGIVRPSVQSSCCRTSCHHS